MQSLNNSSFGIPKVFTFPMVAIIPVPLVFAPNVHVIPSTSFQQVLAPVNRRKRARETASLSFDETDLPSTKKRRLRLVLITSRLSRPFSTPASYIADHGRSRIALWARARQLRSKSLRRAAILNSLSRNGWGTGNTLNTMALPGRLETVGTRTGYLSLGSRLQEDDARGEAEMLEAIHLERRGDSLGVASPVGLSNYDEFDAWKGYVSTHHDEDPGGSTRVPQAAAPEEEEEEEDEFYSDFNFLDPIATSPRDDDDDYDDPFAVLPPDWYDDTRTTRLPDGILTPPEPIGFPA